MIFNYISTSKIIINENVGIVIVILIDFVAVNCFYIHTIRKI